MAVILALALVSTTANAPGQTRRPEQRSLVFLPVSAALPSANARIEPRTAPTAPAQTGAEPAPDVDDDLQKIIPPPDRPPSTGPIEQPEPGVPAQPGKWTATLYVAGDLSCTATLIGPRVLLTAAHCVEPQARFKIGVATKVEDKQPVYRHIDVACEAHPRYRPQGPWARLDYALCLLAEEFPASMQILEPTSKRLPGANNPTSYRWKEAQVRFERLSIDPRDAHYRLGDERSRWVLLAGMGCTDRNLSSRGDGIGQISEGLSLITQRDLLRLTAGAQNRRDSATICQGDSGGAAFRVFTADRHGPRRIIAVNSTNIVIAGRVQQVSFLIKTSAPPFVEFFRSWRRRHNEPKVCGIDIDIEHRCHA